MPGHEVVTVEMARYRAAHWWQRTRDHNRLGFPTRSVLGRMIEEGAQGASHAGQQQTWLAPDDEMVDRLVARMPGDLREALELDVTRWASSKVCAQRLGIGEAEFVRRREQSYGWLAGALTLANLFAVDAPRALPRARQQVAATQTMPAIKTA